MGILFITRSRVGAEEGRAIDEWALKNANENGEVNCTEGSRVFNRDRSAISSRLPPLGLKPLNLSYEDSDKQIIADAKSHYKRTRYWPTVKTKERRPNGVSWAATDWRIRRRYGYGLCRFLQIRCGYKPARQPRNITNTEIKRACLAFSRKHNGRLPGSNSKEEFPGIGGTWSALDSWLRSRGSSLFKKMKELGLLPEHSGNQTGYKGVCKKHNNFVARIWFKNQEILRLNHGSAKVCSVAHEAAAAAKKKNPNITKERLVTIARSAARRAEKKERCSNKSKRPTKS